MIVFCYHVDEPLFNSGRNNPSKTDGVVLLQQHQSVDAVTHSGKLCSALNARVRGPHNWLLASERPVRELSPLPWRGRRQSARGRLSVP